MPRTTKAKQCYHCQGLGHVQAECPTLRLNGGAPGLSNRCYNCDGVGHVAVRFLFSAEVVVRTMLTSSCSATAPTLWFPGASDQDRPSAAAQAVPSSAALARPRATSAAGRTTLLAIARRRR